MTTDVQDRDIPDYPLIIATLNAQTNEARHACVDAVIAQSWSEARQYALAAQHLDEQTGIMLRAWSDSLRVPSSDSESPFGGDPWTA